MKIFNLSTCKLEGANLIEAGAGTGKTYTIAALFLRLIVEKNLGPDKILVVTFTRAAVEELRDRLYKVLQAARDCFSQKKCTEHFINVLKENKDISLTEKLERVTRALRDFDECAIYTIHGFCRRMLLENVFSSGSLYDLELISDQAELLLDAVQDFWRTHIYSAPGFIMAHFLKNGLEPFISLYRLKERNPDLRLETPSGLPDKQKLEKSFNELKKLCRELKNNRPAEPEDTIAWFELKRKILDGRYYQKRYIKDDAAAIQRFCTDKADIIDPDTRKKLTRFTISRLREKSKQGEIPTHKFFKLADRVAGQYDDFKKLEEMYLIRLKARMFAYVETRLTERKKRDNINSFNDFILGLAKSLDGPGGRDLSRAIRQRFPVALIDEFQDTDPSQYTIFKALFSPAVLFLIGDPKQAIYSFRGADVYAYLAAAAQVKNRYTLATNYRSDQRLVQGVNAVFDQRISANPFAEPGISFHPVEAKVKDSPLIIEGEENKPALTIWTIDSSITEDKAITATAARQYINQAVLTEIHRLLTMAAAGRATIRDETGRRPLRPADFAVLTRSKKEMAPLQNLLIQHGIPSVTSSADSIFDTDEAKEMEMLLQALAEPGNEGALKAALAQPLFGLDGRNLQDMTLDHSGWERWAPAFQRYHVLFQETGFLAMFRNMLREQEIKARLLSLQGGERHLTNILHLAEILEQRRIKTGAGLHELLNWFAACCADPLRRDDELEMRMESDDNAVQIVTIHKSKGLEYPIVFAPFVWANSEGRDPLCHNRQGDMTLFLDQQRFAAHQATAFREAMSENLRLFYVALTRAGHRCYTFWAKLTHHSKSYTSAPAWLFLNGDRHLKKSDPIEAMKKAWEELKNVDELKAALCRKLAHVREYVAVETLPGKSGLPVLSPDFEQARLKAAVFPGPMPPAWQIASFSLLTRESHAAGFTRQDNILGNPQPAALSQDKEFTIFTFPKGAGPGTFMHELLEYLDFRAPFTDKLTASIVMALEKYNFDPAFAPAIRQMLQNVVNQPLAGFSLAEIPEERRLNEMEFYFPLKKISPAELGAIFNDTVSRNSINAMFSRQSKGLTFSPTHGYMHGFIDLVFAHQDRYYLIDWKSNYLGDTVNDYNEKAVNQAMSDNFYFLQYHIYTLALHLFLRNRLPDYNYATHFGGVYYLFLRGISPPGENGVYFHKPDEQVIKKMSKIFLKEGAE